MNQGLYGMASGGGASGVRKLSGVTGAGTSGVSVAPTTAWAGAGGGSTLITASAGVRTRLASVSGRGALRFFSSQLSAPATDTERIEVWIDGKRVIDISGSLATASQQGINAVGWALVSAGSYSVSPDYIPFDGSCELWITCTTGGANTASVSYRIDLHE
jgi:hypothetical protein